MEADGNWTRPERVVWVNASGACSGAEAVMLDHIQLAIADGVEVVVASPAGPLVDRLPAEVRHVALPAFGLGIAAEDGRGERARAGGRLIGRTALAARRLRREVRRPGTRVAVNSLLALPAVRLSQPKTPATWLVHDVVGLRAQRAFVRFATGGRRPAIAKAVPVSEATAVPLRPLGCPVDVHANGVAWPVDPVPLDVHEPPVVGSAALLVGWKGHEVLLEAVARLPEVRLELAGGHLPGDEGYVAALHARAEAADLAGRVRFLGHVDAKAAMRTWDVAVLASTSPEAGPLSVLEAMSLGLPVVATDHGGSAEYLRDGRGVLAQPGDPEDLAASIEAALDPTWRAEFATAGRSFVAAHHDRSQTLPAQYRAMLEPLHG